VTIHAGPQTLVDGWVRTQRTPLEQRALDAIQQRPDLSVHDALVTAGIGSAENQLATIVRLLLGGDLGLTVTGQGQRAYSPTPGRVDCPHLGCVKAEHPDHPDCHAIQGAWAADRHDRSEAR